MWYAIQTMSGREKEVAELYNSDWSVLEPGESVFSFDREVFQNIRRRDFTQEQKAEYEARKAERDRIKKEIRSQKTRKRSVNSNAVQMQEKIGLRLFEKVLVPVFPSYIFLSTPSILSFRKRFNSSEGYRLRELLRIHGVGGNMVDRGQALKNSFGVLIGAIRFEERFVPISESCVDRFMEMGGDEHVIRSSTCMNDGEHVKIISGPLAGMEGEIVSINLHRKEARVKMQFFGEERIVALGMDIVRAET